MSLAPVLPPVHPPVHPPVPLRPGVRPLSASSVARTELVTPAMCGPNSLFAGQIGDWTWDAVSAACGINAYDAHDEGGNPTYLSFYYFRIRSGGRFHPLDITFGDRLDVVSSVFGYGSESVLTLHRIRRADGRPPEPIDPHGFYRRPDPDCLYVENFNRWISRTRPGSNRDLARRSPVGFEHRHLPRLPDDCSPRRAYLLARQHRTFHPADDGEQVERLAVDYTVEPSRDLNGVGLLYFASYFSIVDWGLLRLWRHLGRDDRSFLRRTVLDHQLCYLGNAEAGTTIRIELSARPLLPRMELVDAVLRERDTGEVLAVSTQQLLVDDPVGSDGTDHLEGVR